MERETPIVGRFRRCRKADMRPVREQNEKAPQEPRVETNLTNAGLGKRVVCGALKLLKRSTRFAGALLSSDECGLTWL